MRKHHLDGIGNRGFRPYRHHPSGHYLVCAHAFYSGTVQEVFAASNGVLIEINAAPECGAILMNDRNTRPCA
jgi:hypothetical protein